MSGQRGGAASAPWLDDDEPFDPQRSRAQVRGLLRRLGRARRDVLDLGCGAGRIAVELARAGHAVTAIDRSAAALKRCRANLKSINADASLIRANFLQDRWPVSARARFDMVCCLGNTFMLITDIAAGVALLQRARARLKSGGIFAIDDFPQQFWPEVADGRWSNGISEVGSMQMVWAADEPVFTIRTGRRISPQSWRLRKSDRRYRLWTMGELRLAAQTAGLSVPEHDRAGGFLIMRRTPERI